MRTLRRAAAAAGVAALIAVAGASSASADGINIFAGDPAMAWHGGCSSGYSLDARTESDYALAVADGLAHVTSVTGIAFTRVPLDDPSAAIRYVVDDDLPAGVSGWGSTSGDVRLAPAAALPDWRDPVVNAYIREALVIHESLHVLGMDHDVDRGASEPDEIMHAMLPIGPIAFGPGDLAGMGYIRELNGCAASTTPMTPDPPAAGIPEAPIVVGAPPTRRPDTRRHCRVVHHQAYDAADRRCVKAR